MGLKTMKDPTFLGQQILDRYDDAADEANLFRSIYLERSQLYGIISLLLERLGDEFMLFDDDDFKHASESLVVMQPQDNKVLKVFLTKYEKVEEDV